jgi:hypothetical protein
MKAKDNPFNGHAISSIDFRFEPSIEANLVARLEETNWRGAIVGPHGTGKSTLVKFIADLAQEHGKQVTIIDGAEQIRWWNWLVMKHTHKSALIITTHKPGRLPTIHETSTSESLLAELITTLAAVPPNPEFVTDLFTRHRGNIRDCLREMYERCAADDKSWRTGQFAKK